MADKIILREVLLGTPKEALDPSLHPLIATWGDEPTPLQLLEVIDKAIHWGLTNGGILQFLQICYGMTLEDNSTTHEEVVKGASWREEV